MPGSIFANITNPHMKPEDQAWKDLQAHAARQLPGGFADRIVQSARGPTPAAWQQLFAFGAKRLRPGFAERVLRAARRIPGLPSFSEQLAFSFGTAAVCALLAFLIDSSYTEQQNERNLASWKQIAMAVQDIDSGL